jgi:hypothetical protein
MYVPMNILVAGDATATAMNVRYGYLIKGQGRVPA